MRIHVALLAVTLLSCATADAQPATPIPDATLRDAATRSMGLIDRSVGVWQQQRTCFSCHHQALPIAATMLARSRSIPIDEAVARKNISAGLLALKSLDRNVQGYQQIDLSMEVGMELVTGAIAGVPPGITRAATARTVAGWQYPDGQTSGRRSRTGPSWQPRLRFAVSAPTGHREMRPKSPSTSRGPEAGYSTRRHVTPPTSRIACAGFDGPTQPATRSHARLTCSDIFNAQTADGDNCPPVRPMPTLRLMRCSPCRKPACQ